MENACGIQILNNRFPGCILEFMAQMVGTYIEYFCQLIHRDIFHVVIVNIVYSFCRTSFWDALYGFKIQTQHI